MPPRVALLDPPAASSCPRNRLMGEVKLFAPMAGTSTRNDPCPLGREANGIAIDPPLSGGTPVSPSPTGRCLLYQ